VSEVWQQIVPESLSCYMAKAQSPNLVHVWLTRSIRVSAECSLKTIPEWPVMEESSYAGQDKLSLLQLQQFLVHSGKRKMENLENVGISGQWSHAFLNPCAARVIHSDEWSTNQHSLVHHLRTVTGKLSCSLLVALLWVSKLLSQHQDQIHDFHSQVYSQNRYGRIRRLHSILSPPLSIPPFPIPSSPLSPLLSIHLSFLPFSFSPQIQIWGLSKLIKW